MNITQKTAKIALGRMSRSTPDARLRRLGSIIKIHLLTALLASAAQSACATVILEAWGQNPYGELGNNSTINTTVPVAVSGLTSGVTAIAAGYGHSLAVQNGGVYAWGFNTNGQLGDGTTNSRNTPERIDPQDLNNIIAVAASNLGTK